MTANQIHLSHPKYRPDIDGLRAVAILSVLAFHAFPDWMRGGFIGVDIFFVISGYLISTIIYENLDRDTFSFVEFYARRVKRIFPALILVLVSCLVFGWFALLGEELNQLGKHVAGGAAFVSNLLLWNEAGYFDNAAATKPLLHLWSLGVEEQFYIVWPLLLWFSRKRLNWLGIGILIAGVSFYLNMHQVKTDATADFFSPQTRFWELMAGSILAWLTLYRPDFSVSGSANGHRLQARVADGGAGNNHALASPLSILAALLLLYGFWRIDENMGFPGAWAVVPVLGATLLIFAGPGAWVNRTILSSRIAVWFGLISFPLYLWHWPIISFGHILFDGTPSMKFRLCAVILSILLAWLTVVLVEKPIRFGKTGRARVALLCGLVFVLGVAGFVFNQTDLSQSHTYENLAIGRKGSEHAFGASKNWFRGKGDWLFLGNAYENTVAKLKLAAVPSEDETKADRAIFSNLAGTAARFNIRTALIVGPNKSTMYPAYLPDGLKPSARSYISFFLDELKNVPNLVVYYPAADLRGLKATEGLLYWMTDTHWNAKGAFLAYAGFSRLFGLPVPEVGFQHGSIHDGDIIKIAKLKDFPLHPEDNWDVVWKKPPVWTEKEIPDEKRTPFGLSSIVVNQNPLSNKSVWVVGDSYSVGLRQYFNATFREVRYVGHWRDKLEDLPAELIKAERKPDMIVVVRVERSF